MRARPSAGCLNNGYPMNMVYQGKGGHHMATYQGYYGNMPAYKGHMGGGGGYYGGGGYNMPMPMPAYNGYMGGGYYGGGMPYNGKGGYYGMYYMATMGGMMMRH